MVHPVFCPKPLTKLVQKIGDAHYKQFKFYINLDFSYLLTKFLPPFPAS